jgi:hypothetical protein
VINAEIAGFQAEVMPDSAQGLIWLRQSRDVWIHSCRTSRPTKLFLQVESEKSADISLTGNALGKALRILDLGPDVPANKVILEPGL